MSLLQFFAIVMASGAIVDVWFNGSILADKRAWVQAAADTPDAKLALLWELLNCFYCMSYHIPLYLLAGVLVMTEFTPWADVAWLLVYALAATRTSLLINGLLPDHLRYDRPGLLPAVPDMTRAATSNQEDFSNGT